MPKGIYPHKRIPLADRFWSKVDKDGPIKSPALGPCWTWTGSKAKSGYGRIAAPGGSVFPPLIATHVSLSLTGIAVPEGMDACHRCDNPPCVNPDHLYIGTRQRNTDDKTERNRHAREFTLPHTRLSDDDVRMIRSLFAKGARQVDLAKQFGVHVSTMHEIVRGKKRRLA